MIPVPQGYAQAIGPGNLLVSRYVDLRVNSDLTAVPDYFAVPVATGSFTTDSEVNDNGGGFSRTNGRLTLVDDDNRFNNALTRLTPDANNLGWTAPYGATARLMYAVSVPGYTGFYGDSFFYTIAATCRLAENQDEADGQLDLSVYDFARHVSRSKFETPYVIGPGQNYVDSIVTGVQSRLAPNMTAGVVSVPTTEVTPLIVIDPDQDPWAEFEAMAQAIGYVLYFDQEGKITLIPRPDVSTADPVRTFIHGADAIVAMARNLSDDPGYNGVLMRSDSSVLSAPIQSVVWDLDPDSPTYAYGPYGRILFSTSSPYIANQAQADSAASAMLTAVLGLTEKIAISCLPDPALRVNDVVYVYRARGGVPVIDGNYVVDQITLPLALTEPMTLQLHRQRSSA